MKKKGTFHLLSERTVREVSLLLFEIVFSDSFIVVRNNLVI